MFSFQVSSWCLLVDATIVPCLGNWQGGAIIFIDELDAIGTKRFGGEQSGDREVQRTMLELLNQLDGFSSNEKIKVRRCRDEVLDWRPSFATP